MEARITYYLTETGQKALLTQGGDGKREQVLTVDVGESDLDLLDVNGDGALSASAGQHESPQTGEQLLVHLRDEAGAAQKRKAQELVEEAERKDRHRKIVSTVCQQYLDGTDDSEIICVDIHNPRLVRWSGSGSISVSEFRDIPVVARALTESAVRVKAREQREAQKRTEAEAEKQRKVDVETDWISGWVGEYGNMSMLERQEAGVLPRQEVLDAAEDRIFADAGVERYERLTVGDVDHGEYCQAAEYDAVEIEFGVEELDELNADQWAEIQAMSERYPDAEVAYKLHTATCESCGAVTERHGIIVREIEGPFTFRREFCAID